ncbi:hypothetical protein [Parabacteroides sp. FAFU027]|uniref:hypothetical protein n=1 Tax=Parabacteroides sp. FAFU027 TaxID=2922715 RepID=UPI001FB03C19|nr:hypothetical protein [Parabacteroides sp. FAFU027]
MKRFFIIPAILLFTITSCNKLRIKKHENVETPKALQKESSLDIVSKCRYDDMATSLYNEQVEKSPELKKLETKLEMLSTAKGDSTSAYNIYNRSNQSYYNSAKNHLNLIQDSLLRKKIESLINKSLSGYNTRISRHNALLKSIEAKESYLNDLHQILIITTTLPLIEKFQKDNQPSTQPIEGYSKQIDKVLNYEKALIKK